MKSQRKLKVAAEPAAPQRNASITSLKGNDVTESAPTGEDWLPVTYIDNSPRSC